MNLPVPLRLGTITMFGIGSTGGQHLLDKAQSGESAPIPSRYAAIERLQSKFGRPTFNLYGPTETNVCTWYEIPSTISEDRVEPYPIGQTSSQLENVVVDSNGNPIAHGAEGKLCIAGPNLMQGYWAMPELSAQSFLSEDASGRRWYRTDIDRQDRLSNVAATKLEAISPQISLPKDAARIVRLIACARMPIGDWRGAYPAHSAPDMTGRISTV